MRLVAKKPCSFEGKKFFIDDEIPVELVANPKDMEKMGVLAIVGDGSAATTAIKALVESPEQIGEINIPIHAEEGDLILCVTAEELVVFTDILQIPVSKAEDKQKITDMIQNIENEDLLIMLDALDGRKHVKEEAQARAQAINAQAEPEESEESEEPEELEEPDGDDMEGD